MCLKYISKKKFTWRLVQKQGGSVPLGIKAEREMTEMFALYCIQSFRLTNTGTEESLLSHLVFNSAVFKEICLP